MSKFLSSHQVIERLVLKRLCDCKINISLYFLTIRSRRSDPISIGITLSYGCFN